MPARKQLSDDVLQCPTNRLLLRCLVCHPINDRSVPPVDDEHWLERKNYGKHALQNRTHLSIIRRQMMHQESEQSRLASITSSFAEAEIAALLHDQPHYIQTLSSPMPLPESSTISEPAGFEEMLLDYEWDPQDFATQLSSAEIQKKERDVLSARLETYSLWDTGRAVKDLVGDAKGEEFWDMEEDVSELDKAVADVMENISDVCHPLNGDDIQRMAFGASSKLPDPADMWFPYGSKINTLLDLIYNNPRHRVSNGQMRMFLWVLKEMGLVGAPSFYEFIKLQKMLRSCNGVPTHQFKSAHGNNYFQNDVRTIVSQDYANPLVCSHLHHYPEIPDGPISEIWQSARFRKGLDVSMLTPMYVATDGRKHYYVGELARCHNTELILPIRWVVYHGKLHAEAYRVVVDARNNMAHICSSDDDIVLVDTGHLTMNFFDLQREHLIPTFDDPKDHSLVSQMPNKLRELAQGAPMFSSFVDLFGDDVSGNRSKAWNKHNNLYLCHRNLPRELLQQDFHIHFLSTSQHASVPEQIEGFKSQIESTHVHPVCVQHAVSGEIVRFRLFLNAEPMDNPAASEASGHIGGHSNCNCRKCKIGGTQREKMTDEVYDSLFHVGSPRSATETLQEVMKQVSKACTGVASRVEERQKASGVKDGYTQHWIDDLISRARALKAQDPMRSEESVYNELMEWVIANQEKIFNPNLRMKGFDPTQDTPIEILHTILLGIVKYVWHESWSNWSAEEKRRYALRLQATDIHGLTVPPIRAAYITQYANSLVGRQLKTVGQTAVFHVYDIVKPDVFRLWKAVGLVMALLWIPEIDNMDQYTADLETATANVADLFAIVDPSKIIWKSKLHLLPHTAQDVRRFGPLIGLCTEAYECFNQIFRQCSIFSNHLAPSRDIAYQLANQEGLKHRLTGGWWPSASASSTNSTTQNDDMDIPTTWVRAGLGVRDLLHKAPNVQRILGWVNTKPKCPGSVRLEAIPQNRPSRPAHMWRSTLAANTLNAADYASDPLPWNVCKSVICASGDECEVGTWIAAPSPMCPGTVVFGRILQIITHETPSTSIAVIDVFDLAAQCHTMWEMPCLTRRFGEKRRIVVTGSSILFDFNVQHDCARAQCSDSGKREVRQERLISGKSESFIEHRPVDEYIINLHALHNAHRIRRVLPRNLTAPIPLFATPEARRACHDSLAAKLRAEQQGKDDRASSLKRRREEGKQKTALEATEPREPSGSHQQQPQAERPADVASGRTAATSAVESETQASLAGKSSAQRIVFRIPRPD